VQVRFLEEEGGEIPLTYSTSKEGLYPYFLNSVFSVLSVVKASPEICEGIWALDHSKRISFSKNNGINFKLSLENKGDSIWK